MNTYLNLYSLLQEVGMVVVASDLLHIRHHRKLCCPRDTLRRAIGCCHQKSFQSPDILTELVDLLKARKGSGVRGKLGEVLIMSCVGIMKGLR